MVIRWAITSAKVITETPSRSCRATLERIKGNTHRDQNIYSVFSAKGSLERLVRQERLETPAWRGAVLAALFRYLISRDQKLDLLDSAVQDLQRYERAERMTVLGWAVWKAVCQMQMTEKGGYLSALEWARSGWKACKAQQRYARAMTIMSVSVSPFLEAFES
jgi:hypothetical protein